MYAIEFQAPIENGVVRIPKKYQEIQDNAKATFIVMYHAEKPLQRQSTIDDELDELFSHSNNKIQATMKLSTDINEMVNDGVL